MSRGAEMPESCHRSSPPSGRLVVDESATLPDATEVELLPLDPGDWLTGADRHALHAGPGCGIPSGGLGGKPS